MQIRFFTDFLPELGIQFKKNTVISVDYSIDAYFIPPTWTPISICWYNFLEELYYD